MGECAVLDGFDEDGFHSCEGFTEWSTYGSGHWSESEGDGSGLEDWSSFHGSLSKELESDPSPEERHSDHKHKVVDREEISPWCVFRDCFRTEETVKEVNVTEIQPLSQLLHNSTHAPSHLSSEASSLCHRLLYGTDSLRSSDPRHSPHSHKQLVNSLQLQPSDTSTSQRVDLPDLGFEEPESSSAVLIQTKLTAPTLCQNKPGYLYQISHQWFSQQSLRLLPIKN
ncbi:uncharacterized protein si:dkey-229e3.2 [Hoplias malabaricus]|uniref:uncharacterized protein si:dkey-229e3.2 n=1 Tax=Hoplias malabaricus TaxID=27720 RepID=UPI00346373BD